MGYHVAVFTPIILIGGAIVVCFVIMAQVTYPNVLAIYSWISNSNPQFRTEPSLSHFSMSHCAIGLFIMLVIICSKKDISIFMKMTSFGVIGVTLLMLFILVTGIIALTNTNFSVGNTESESEDWMLSDER